MTLRDSKFTPIAFWVAFLALGFITSSANPAKSPRSVAVVAERESSVTAGASAKD